MVNYKKDLSNPPAEIKCYDFNGEVIVMQPDVAKYMQCGIQKIKSMVLRGLFPPSDGLIPNCQGHPITGKYWLLQTIRDWEMTHDIDIARAHITTPHRAKKGKPITEIGMMTLTDAAVPIAGLGERLSNLIATQSGLTGRLQGETVVAAPDSGSAAEDSED